MMKSVGFVGWRGMVGSVLLNRMQEENDFLKITPHFFSTSQSGKDSPIVPNIACQKLKDAYNLNLLAEMDIIITCQGASYTNAIYSKLRKNHWQGYWIDAASTLRVKNDAIIVLDPINLKVIETALDHGIKTFVGSNCTVSLMLMALGGLFANKLIEWIYVSTYQAASGAGAQNIVELLKQMGALYSVVSKDLLNNTYSILDIIKKVTKNMQSENFPLKYFSAPLAGSLIPWIDVDMGTGQSREEWKGQFETNKILGSTSKVIIDGTCVRISAIRCHSQSILIKLNKNISLKNIEEMIVTHNKWVDFIPNNVEETTCKLTPSAVTGTLKIPVGRLRKLSMGDKYFSVFTVGDQLLWGAAEPLRRMLNLLINI